MKVEAPSLEEAITKAANLLECSVMELEYEIVQQAKNGFLGFGKKSAIIEAKSLKKTKPKKDFKANSKSDKSEFEPKFENEKHFKKNKKPSDKLGEKPRSDFKQDFKNEIKQNEAKQNEPKLEKDLKELSQELKKEPLKAPSYKVKSDNIFDNFHKESMDTKDTGLILAELRVAIENLLKSTGFKISLIELKIFDENSIYIKLDGEDAALMIGKEAHRYKALSYLLHNWINVKYGFLVRLEIAQFLQNQIENMQLYLQSVISKVKRFGSAKTKHLDGVLIKIALESLRAEFPDKYVGIKQNDDQRFVVINDFLKKNE